MNRKFRQIIRRIDDARKPQRELERVMANDKEFAQFINYMLQVIGFRPHSTDEHGADLEQNALGKYDPVQEDVDAMNDNDKFKYLLRQMLTNEGF